MPKKIIDSKAALEVIEEFWLDVMEELNSSIRDQRDTPDPRDTASVLFSHLHQHLNLGEEELLELEGKFQAAPEHDRIALFRQAWHRDWLSRGFLSTNPERTTASQCGVSANCWSSSVVAAMLAYKRTIELCIDEFYPQKQAKVKGPVYTRNFTGKNRRR